VLPKLDKVYVSPKPVHSSDAATEKCHVDSDSQASNDHPENIASFFSWMHMSRISFEKLSILKKRHVYFILSNK
jgi:hypothetical protein